MEETQIEAWLNIHQIMDRDRRVEIYQIFSALDNKCLELLKEQAGDAGKPGAK